MPKDQAKFEDWAQEQTAKSLFFHQKLHEWGLLEVARAIEAFDGSRVEWNLQDLCISEHAWNRVIHGGIAPVRVFAHPAVLQSIARSVGYYRCTYQLNQLLYHLHVVCQPAHQSRSRYHLAQFVHKWLTLYCEKPCLTEGFEHLRGGAVWVQHCRYPDIRVNHGAHC